MTRVVLLSTTLLSSLPRLSGQEIETVKPMAREAHPSFEVAAIKLSDPNNQSGGFHTNGRRIFIENRTVNFLIAFAYGMQKRQIVNEPAWLTSERFDIRGVPDIEGQPSEEQEKEMVRKLLEERFHLKFHREQRQMSRYTLTVAKGGEKMTPTRSSPDALPDQTGHQDASQESWRFTNNSMQQFAQFLQFTLDRPVVDETGLTGRFDFKLQWTKDTAPATEENAPPIFFTAIQEQIGLKVEPSNGAVDVLVIDGIGRPSVN